MQFDKGDVIDKMWQYNMCNMKKVIWKIQFIMINSLWKNDKWNMKIALWRKHCDNMINTMWKKKFEKCNVENAIQQMQCKKMNLTNVM